VEVLVVTTLILHIFFSTKKIKFTQHLQVSLSKQEGAKKFKIAYRLNVNKQKGIKEIFKIFLQNLSSNPTINCLSITYITSFLH
jgi:hypothetical protein